MSNQVFGTKEWAEYSFNCVNGCEHNCRYCYAAKIAIRYGRKKSREGWRCEELINKMEKIKKLNGRVMTPTTHDITPKNYDHVIIHVQKLLEVGNELLIVSKMHKDVAQRLKKDLFRSREKIMFRISIGSMNNDVLKFWEPNAPEFLERFESLKMLYAAGYETSVSVEPMLWDDIDDLIETCRPYCTNSIWLGKMNNHVELEDRYGLKLKKLYEIENILSLYRRYKKDSKIKWKDSFKKIIGLNPPQGKGLDI